MVIEDARNREFEYLEKASPIFLLFNTFRKIDFTKLNKYIQNLKVPEMLKI